VNTIKEIGECELIHRLSAFLPDDASVICGAGDDCAVVRSPNDPTHDLLLTSDAVMMNCHFTPDTPAIDVGRKAIARPLSDIAAMGGEASWALINLVAPPDTQDAFIEDLYRGAVEMSGAHGLTICGGDTASGDALAMHVFVVGSVPRDQAVLRSGANPGDPLFVTGALGGQYQSQLSPLEPRLRQGQWLRDWANAMIDISDGAATDVRHLAEESGVGFKLDSRQIPISDEAAVLPDSKSLLEHALTDGEDYELLFTVPAEREEAFSAAWAANFELDCTHIGKATARANHIELETAEGKSVVLSATGYDHFS
jgi:thiamine-monophosphate kinase